MVTRLSWRNQGQLQRQHEVKCQKRQRNQAAHCLSSGWKSWILQLTEVQQVGCSEALLYFGTDHVKAKSCLEILREMTKSWLFAIRSCPPSPCATSQPAPSLGETRVYLRTQSSWGGVKTGIQRLCTWSWGMQTPSMHQNAVWQDTSCFIHGRYISPVQHSLPWATSNESAPEQVLTGLVLSPSICYCYTHWILQLQLLRPVQTVAFMLAVMFKSSQSSVMTDY